PQQYEILEQHIEDQNKINMPLLSDDQLQEINEKVSSKISKNILTDLDYWQDGYIYSIQCYINKIDELNGFMIITNSNSNNKLRISLSSIVSVQ
ncbi:YolD-like family protein, partial [Mammaliicoccus lentus]